jgi:hypothetical protein
MRFSLVPSNHVRRLRVSLNVQMLKGLKIFNHAFDFLHVGNFFRCDNTLLQKANISIPIPSNRNQALAIGLL